MGVFSKKIEKATIVVCGIFRKERIVERCDNCGKVVSVKDVWGYGSSSNNFSKKFGVIFSDRGFSIGGWGRRSNHNHSFSGEVCEECFEVVKDMWKVYDRFIDRKGINKKEYCPDLQTERLGDVYVVKK